MAVAGGLAEQGAEFSGPSVLEVGHDSFRQGLAVDEAVIGGQPGIYKAV